MKTTLLRQQPFETSMTLLSAATPALLLIYHLKKNAQARRAQAEQTSNRHADSDTPQGPKPWFSGTGGTPFNLALNLDLSLSTLVFLRFAYQEVKAKRVKGPFWLYAALNICVGLSPAFPLLLLMRNESTGKPTSEQTDR